MTVTLFRDNRLPVLAGTITYEDGTTVNLTSASVKLKMRPANSAALKVDSAGSVVTGADGTVSYPWATGDVDTVGNYKAWWEVTLSGLTQDTPEFDVEIIEHAPESSVVPSPVATDGSGLTTIYKGDSYSNTYGRALTYQLQLQDSPDITGLTVKWRIYSGVTGVLEKTMTVVGEDAVYVELTSAETAALSAQTYLFEIEATVTGSEYVTLLRGQLVVNPDVTHVP